MATKPFDGVKMGKTKSRDYKVGNKKLKNIKMFEEFANDSDMETIWNNATEIEQKKMLAYCGQSEEDCNLYGEEWNDLPGVIQDLLMGVSPDEDE